MNIYIFEGLVNYRFGGVRKCRGLFEVKFLWYEVYIFRYNRGSLSRFIIFILNKWRVIFWRVFVVLILFILLFKRIFLLYFMVFVK